MAIYTESSGEVAQADQIPTIIRQAGKGISVSLLATFATLPVNLFLYSILGRVGPQVLGFYALLTLLVGLLMTLGFFGDSLAYVKYIPETSEALRFSFVLSHSVVVAVQGALLIGCFLLFPGVLQFFLGPQANRSLALFALLLGPLVWAQGVLSSVLQSVLDTGWQAAALRVPSLVSLVIAVPLVVFYPALFAKNYVWLIPVVILAANAAGLAVLMKRSWDRVFSRVPRNWRFYFPPGFWRFCGALQLTTLASFAFLHLDQILIARTFSIATLGQYKAILSFAELVRLAPLVVGTTAYPLLVHLKESEGDLRQTHQYARALSDFVFMGGALTAVVCALFGPDLVRLLFGPSYSQAALPMGVLSIGYSLTGVSLLASAMLISKGRSDLIFAANAVSSVVQLAVCLGLVSSFGLMGVVIGRVASLAVYSALTCLWAREGTLAIPSLNSMLGLVSIAWLPIVIGFELSLRSRMSIALATEMLLVGICFRIWQECKRKGLRPVMLFTGWHR